MTAVEAPPIETELHEIVSQPEAGFSLNWQMVDTLGATVQVTMRTARVAEWPDVMKHRAAFLQKATEKGWAVPSKLPNLPSPAPQPTASAPAPALAQASSNGNGALVLDSARMEVVPGADGKSEVKFYADGHQYPDLYTKRTPAQLAVLLQPTGQWTPDHFTKAGTHAVPMRIEYKLSDKKNSKGNPYKDIVAVKPW
jgi:hypothetical protein